MTVRSGFLAVAAAVALLSVGACRQSMPGADTTASASQANGTISGNVRGPVGASVLQGRAVEVIDVSSGERQLEKTSSTGEFRFRVKPGAYRVEVTLRDGESIITAPGVIHVKTSAADAHADVVVGGAQRAPRHPPASNSTTAILGPPIA